MQGWAAPLPSAMQASRQRCRSCRQRLKFLDRFKAKTDTVLIATDVAARGLDIDVGNDGCRALRPLLTCPDVGGGPCHSLPVAHPSGQLRPPQRPDSPRLSQGHFSGASGALPLVHCWVCQHGSSRVLTRAGGAGTGRPSTSSSHHGNPGQVGHAVSCLAIPCHAV